MTIPFFPWRAALSERFNLVEGERPELSRKKFEDGIADLWGTPNGQLSLEAAHSIGYLFGLDWPDSPYLGPLRANPQLAQGRAFYWIQQVFTRMGALQPLVLVLEDLHWADSGTIELLNYLLGAGEGLPLYIVGATRPELFEKFPALRDATTTRTHLRLQPLTAEAAHALLQHIFDQAAAEHIPAELIERVTRQAEGNPYYLEELVKVLVERGVIVTAPTGWRVVVEKLVQMQLPDTLQGLLQTRLDALEPQEKSTAQHSAVVGRNFWIGVLEAMQPDANVFTDLKQLEVREMIYPRHESAFVGEREYIFKTMLLRDVAYETLPRKQRRVYHAKIAAWLKEMSSDDPTWAAQIAEHYEQADQRKEAVELYRLAADGAAKRFTNREAVDLYTRALGLTDNPKEKFELLVGRERANDWLGQRAKQREDVEQLLEMAKQLQSPELETQALNRRANLLARTGDSAGATATAQQALEEAQRLNLPGEEAQALRNLSVIAYFNTQMLESLQYAERSLHASRSAKDGPLMIDNLNLMGVVSGDMGYYDQALRHYEEARRQAEAQGDDWRRARVLGNASILESDLGRYQMALAQKNEVLDLQRKMGNRNSEAIAYSNLGDEYRLVGQFDLAEEKFQESIKLFKPLESLWGLAGTLSSQALMRIDQGQYAEALAILNEAHQVIRGRKVAQGAMIEIFNRRIWANLRLGDLAAVGTALAETEQWLDETGFEPANKELAQLDSYKAEYQFLKGDAVSAVTLSAEAIKLSKGHRLPSEVMRLIWWIHYRALLACGYTEQALVVLNDARKLVERSAEELSENLRESFLQNVYINQVILAEAQRVRAMAEGEPSN
jgi:predicted ATPase